jgi:hypothetical protein
MGDECTHIPKWECHYCGEQVEGRAQTFCPFCGCSQYPRLIDERLLAVPQSTNQRSLTLMGGEFN